MIDTLHIRGFRAIREASLADLRGVNLVVGPNASGKTSLLRAAFALGLEGNAGGLVLVAPPETERTNWEGLDRALSLLFHGGSGPGLEVRGTIAGEQRSVRIDRVETAKAVAPPATTNGPGPDLERMKAGAAVVYHVTTEHAGRRSVGNLYLSPSDGVFTENAKATPPYPTSLTQYGARPDAGLARMWSNLEGTPEGALAVELLRLIEPDVESVRIAVAPEDQPVLRVQHKRLGAAPPEAMGDGFVSALRIACVIGAFAGGAVLIDEFDASLHVGVIRRVAEFILAASERTGTQVFLTTHRLESVDEFVNLAPAGPDRLSLVQAARREGRAEFRVIPAANAVALRQTLAVDLRQPV